MNQKLTVAVDHGNRNMKTSQFVFTSGIIESDCKPVLGEFLFYNGHYYTLSEQRIFIEDICANAKGYELLYQVQKRGR